MEGSLLTIEEFATKMGISRSTVYGWLAEGKLVVGHHVVRIGRVVRIIWNDDLISHLLAISAEDGEEPEQRPRLKRNGKGSRNRVALNIDYLENLP